MRHTKPILALLAASLTSAHAANWYEEMKIGPAWSNTFEDFYQGQKRVAALKGILAGLGDGNSNALFDTETLRLVCAYQGYVNWAATPWTGQHGVLISLQDNTPVFNTASGPRWADADGSFDDKRKIPGFGNLTHATYNGYFRSGTVIVFDYSVLGSRVLETSSINNGTVTRSLQIDARKSNLTGLVADEAHPFTIAADGLSAKSADGLNVSLKGPGKLAADPKNPNRLLVTIAKGADKSLL